MRHRTRLAGLAIATAAALVPAAGAATAQASIPDLKLTPCELQWVKAPDTTSIFDDAPAKGGADDFDVENGTAHTPGVEDGPNRYDTVEHDDLTYDCQ